MLMDKNIVIGVTGGIACYKACELTSRLIKLGANVDVIMTKNSLNFVNPKTFESLSNNPVIQDTFEREGSFDIKHVSLAKKADLLVIAPATANIIGKIANGIADDMLSTTVMATDSPVLICPAMNTTMWNNKIFKKNLDILKENGYIILDPVSGRLACGDEGIGKMAEPEIIADRIEQILFPINDLTGKTVLITVGGTEEAIDAVRVITNKSSGKMGAEIARECKRRGAKVILIIGKVSVDMPKVDKSIKVATTNEMYNAVMKEYEGCDYIIKAAAPSDYRLENVFPEKLKSDKIDLRLVKNVDIAKALGVVKGERKLIIFSAETENLLDNAKAKLKTKNADMVVANDVTLAGAGFMADTNIITILKKDGSILPYDIMSKAQVAKVIVDNMIK